MDEDDVDGTRAKRNKLCGGVNYDTKPALLSLLASFQLSTLNSQLPTPPKLLRPNNLAISNQLNKLQ
jgi:hypothetical protein